MWAGWNMRSVVLGLLFPVRQKKQKTHKENKNKTEPTKYNFFFFH